MLFATLILGRDSIRIYIIHAAPDAHGRLSVGVARRTLSSLEALPCGRHS